MEVKIEESWRRELAGEWDKDYFVRLTDFVRAQYRAGQVFPPGRKIFAAFDATPFEAVKVVILGQDPYHDVGQANGLCFSVAPGVPFPPSLLNIFKEVQADTGAPIPADGDLTRWARQGVLLLNATLTVRDGHANSHAKCGWGEFTDEVIRLLSAREKPMVFILWGGNARAKKQLIDTKKHFIVESAHPSPLSASYGFFGSKPFSKTNGYLKSIGETPIDWSLNN